MEAYAQVLDGLHVSDSSADSAEDSAAEDLNVSRICMGCMGFGDAANGQHSWTLDQEHSRDIIQI